MYRLFLFLFTCSLGLVYTPQRLCACQERSPLSSVKANMHTLQTALETYAVDWKGTYPSHLSVLVAEAQQADYWKDFRNPVTRQDGLNGAIMDYPAFVSLARQAEQEQYQLSAYLSWPPRYVMGVPVNLSLLARDQKKKQALGGLVLYKALDAHHYVIYGTDNTGQLIQDREHVFELSNS